MTMKLHETDRSGKDFGHLVISIALMVVIASALILFGTAGTSDGAVGDTQTIGGLEYEITGSSEVELVGFSVEPTSSLDVPSTVTIDGSTYNVTSIGERSFFDCSGITEVALGVNIESIGEAAFAGCTGIEEISFGSDSFPSVEYGSLATGSYFYVTTPGWDPYAILNDESLMIFSSDGAYSGTAVWRNPPEQELGTRFEYSGLGFRFYETWCVAVTYNGDVEGDITIPSTVVYDGYSYAVTKIEAAFTDCKYLTEVTIPPTVTVLGSNCFAGTGLEFVVIPGYVETLQGDCFTDCKDLTTVILNSGTQKIGSNTFAGCTSLVSIDIPASIITIDNNAFDGCTSLTSVCFEGSEPPEMDSDAFSTGTTILVDTPGWNPVTAMADCIDENTTVVWSVTTLTFLSDPVSDGVVAPSKSNGLSRRE